MAKKIFVKNKTILGDAYIDSFEHGEIGEGNSWGINLTRQVFDDAEDFREYLYSQTGLFDDKDDIVFSEGYVQCCALTDEFYLAPSEQQWKDYRDGKLNLLSIIATAEVSIIEESEMTKEAAIELGFVVE